MTVQQLRQRCRRAVVAAFTTLFLPEGYPASVSADYTRYQVCDTLQALCSSVTGTLSTRSILRGVGVGEVEATVLGSTLNWVLRDGVAMVSRLAFASIISSDLDNDAKRYRLVADITNDVGLFLEIFSSHLPVWLFFPVICLAAIFKSICGVAGGATRASLTQHFALVQNTADVSAKDGSQETAVNLLGMFLGIAVAMLVPETFAPTCLIVALVVGLHLLSNYVGVKSLVLHHFNEGRYLAVLRHMASAPINSAVPEHHLGANLSILSPALTNVTEPVVLPVQRPVPVSLGVSFADVRRRMKQCESRNDGTAVVLLDDLTLRSNPLEPSQRSFETATESLTELLERNGFAAFLEVRARHPSGSGLPGRGVSQDDRGDSVTLAAYVVFGAAVNVSMDSQYYAETVLHAYAECVADSVPGLRAALLRTQQRPTPPAPHTVSSPSGGGQPRRGSREGFLQAVRAAGWRTDRTQMRVRDVRAEVVVGDANDATAREAAAGGHAKTS